MKQFAVLAVLCGPVFAAASARPYDAGVARIDITPKKSIWMSGYGNRTKPSQGVLQPLMAKALAIRDDQNNGFVLVTTDLIGLSRSITDAVSARVAKEYRIDRSRIMFNSSHTHTGPFVKSNLVTMFEFTPADQAVVDEYARELTDNLFNVIGASLARMEAVDLTYGVGKATFAINRRAKNPNGTFKIAVNESGPTDHSVPVLRVVANGSNKTIAIVTGYTCHNTTLTGEFYELSGDYAGYAQDRIEKLHPGVTAMFVLLCGGDQNPNPRSSLELAQKHGEELADAVHSTVNAGAMRRIEGRLMTAYEQTTLPFAIHTRETFEKELSSKLPAAVRRAKLMLAKYDEGHPVRSTPYPVQAVAFGKSLTLLALGGEVVIDYQIRAKREFPKANLLVLGYSNDVMCYIASKRVIQEGGYEAVDSMIYYGQPGPLSEDAEEAVFEAIHRVMKRVTVK